VRATGTDTPAPLGRGRGEGQSARGGGGETVADRWSPPARRRGRARGPAGLDCAGLG
jgi:hypothetical protein